MDGNLSTSISRKWLHPFSFLAGETDRKTTNRKTTNRKMTDQNTTDQKMTSNLDQEENLSFELNIWDCPRQLGNTQMRSQGMKEWTEG